MIIENHILERVYLPTETLGSWYNPKGDLICKTMELPWLNNRRDDPKTIANEASCIPEGTYLLMKQAPSFGRTYGYFRFKDVPGRGYNSIAKASTILVHRITYVKDLLGCIGVGEMFKDLNGDNVPDMTGSSKTLEKMYRELPDQFYLTIRKKA